jgi:hypothetical protein
VSAEGRQRSFDAFNPVSGLTMLMHNCGDVDSIGVNFVEDRNWKSGNKPFADRRSFDWLMVIVEFDLPFSR